ncbi:MAG: transcriptional repressor [Alphaproteobacteria bacterium]|nr:transcriptional repressor [Alphaproteobacteria bacterium]
MARTSKLSKHPSQLVLTQLRASRQPMPAYAILSRLKSKGVNSPPIIYRALASLEKKGMVHRLASINSYIACNCAADHDHALSVLTICVGCKKVEERHDHRLIDHLEKLRGMSVELPSHAVIELPVVCEGCQP